MPRRSLLWPDPRVKPPFGAAEIDWGHPLASGLVFYAPLNEGGGLPLDLVSRISATTKTGATWLAGYKGLEAGFTEPSRMSWGDRPEWNPTNLLTVACLCRPSGTAGNDVPFSKNTSTTGA